MMVMGGWAPGWSTFECVLVFGLGLPPSGGAASIVQ